MLDKLNDYRLNIIFKENFGQTKLEYLILWVAQEDIRPENIEVHAIVNMNPSTQ